ncbi:hypothetical protein [Roseibium sp.]|uniref:hypothetical protein n=1 Tax=Roseibium sp. TaxID=1936156 RepID=UPI003D128B3C
MIEAAMYMALGFCTAGLIGLAILPAFYRRAARLTEEALRAVNPSSYAEVRAAQDQARAQHAVDLRRVERQLDAEREKAARFQIEAAGLKAKLENLQKTFSTRETELETRVAAFEGDRHAVDMLSSEVKSLKEKLAEAEKALSESWTKALEDTPPAKGSGEKAEEAGLLPAQDTLALATITGLEAEVAMLRARLARYEPVVASEVETSLEEAAKARLAEMERQLVDMESDYVAAQAEVTRLSLMLEAAGANAGETEMQRRLAAQLDKTTRENIRQQADLKDKELRLERLSGQVQTLKKDLENAPALAALRQDFKALAAKVSGSKGIKLSTSSLKVKSRHPAVSAKITAGSDMEAGQNPAPGGNVNGSLPARNGSSPAQQTEGDQAAAPSKPADIASAAQALVSRIVASSRNSEEARTSAASTGTPVETGAASEQEPAGETGPQKQKNKVVA